ncbi:angiopoietin-related protein 4-like isoform X2 [Drosophila innubila]|nr:angiopoietin-related protein 4-like isoform X2 [Drosophila innubila]
MDLQILKAEQEREGKVIDDLKTELEQQKINGVGMESNIQLLKAQLEQQKEDSLEKESSMKLLKTELEQQKKYGVDRESNIQLLRTELEQQKKYGVDIESNIQLLRTELEQHKSNGVDKESKIHFLTAELERQGKLIGDLNMQLNNQSLKEEQKRQGKLIEELVQESKKLHLMPHPPNCTDAKSSGINEILIPKFSCQPFKVACDAETRGGGWTIILRRMDGTVDFYRNWAAYKEGFGDLNGEFFLGLDKIHALTEERNQELLVVLEDNEGTEAFEM